MMEAESDVEHGQFQSTTTSRASSVQLKNFGSSDEALNEQIQALPPVDGGKDAWIVLAAAFVLEAAVWGFPFSYGVFQEYYLNHEPFKEEPAGIAAISTTATGIMYLSSPVVAFLLQRWPRIRRPLSSVGFVVMIAALIGASFSNSTGALLVTQGVLYGLGGLTLYFPAMYIIDEWFVARKGLAYGVVWTGTGTSGAIVPFLVQWLLDSYGFRSTLRIWTVIATVLATPAFLAMKNRIPPSHNSSFRPLNLSFTKKAPFWIFQFANFMQSLAFFLPQLWIPSFAKALDLPSFAGPLGLCMLNIGAIGGYLLHGFLVDRFEVTAVMLLSSTVAGISIFVFWGLSKSQPMLYVFALLWGVSGGGFSATWSGCARVMGRSQSNPGDAGYGLGIDTGLVIGLMCISKGTASLISGPISEQLLMPVPGTAGSTAYATQYGSIIVFAGVMAVLGGIPFLGKCFKVL